ncbi:glycoside hydrolase family 73 protein [Lewinella sp. JB7]|uniref:glycoside hydrolase family 73 protein n=1 Tax=Lewinella sp. JB7 TaxID=2962887 RepID=UPI0020C96C7F|nr:glucosaminidase domain-containing protein [Lewinella sp. JB7]MCP9236437.1 glucosaminidase domain-containing protein [Lewinella sp. JB7]
MKVNLPIPRSWRLYVEDLYRRIYRQVTSPWTKVSVLILLAILVTRKELSFTISINGDGLLGLSTASVFGGGDRADGKATLVSFRPENREWSARELKQLEYVSNYRKIAIAQMKAHGIPASITLAQGLLESGTGQSTLATRNNNHFGLKCFSKSCRKGHCSNHSDDHHKDFFRIFKTPEESYLAHSNLLRKDRYRKLFSLDPTDYRGWARGLSKAGYATDPKYADKLIRMIETLELHRLDA